MTTQLVDEMPEIVRPLARLILEGFATGDPAVVDEVCAQDFVEHQFGLEASGPEALDGLRSAIRGVHEMIPDSHYTIEDFAVREDRVWIRCVNRGTATGPFLGPPSGRPVTVAVMDVVRMRDGRIVEHWGVPDRFAILAQTGVLRRLSQ
ncbi:ester cyclase [Agromyces bauzanensis]